jgi:hypothetical protein
MFKDEVKSCLPVEHYNSKFDTVFTEALNKYVLKEMGDKQPKKPKSFHDTSKGQEVIQQQQEQVMTGKRKEDKKKEEKDRKRKEKEEKERLDQEETEKQRLEELAEKKKQEDLKATSTPTSSTGASSPTSQSKLSVQEALKKKFGKKPTVSRATSVPNPTPVSKGKEMRSWGNKVSKDELEDLDYTKKLARTSSTEEVDEETRQKLALEKT